MKRITFLTILASLVVLDVQAQDAAAAPAKPKITVKAPKLRDIETPQFSVGNVGERRWSPKKWLEVDTEFEVRLPPSAGGRNGSLDSLTINLYIGFNHKTKDGKPEFVKSTLVCVDIPSAQSSHLLAYLPPATLRRILEKDTFSPSSDIQAWGVEVMWDNERVVAESSTGGPWWEKTEALALVDGTLLPKKETPYSILWGDYDVSVKKQ